jgi:hypothetical protein
MLSGCGPRHYDQRILEYLKGLQSGDVARLIVSSSDEG